MNQTDVLERVCERLRRRTGARGREHGASAAGAEMERAIKVGGERERGVNGKKDINSQEQKQTMGGGDREGNTAAAAALGEMEC